MHGRHHGSGGKSKQKAKGAWVGPGRGAQPVSLGRLERELHAQQLPEATDTEQMPVSPEAARIAGTHLLSAEVELSQTVELDIEQDCQ